MRKIKMTSISAGPDGVKQIETVHDLPDNEAEALVCAKHAVYVDGKLPTVEPAPRMYSSLQAGIGKKARWQVVGPDGVVADGLTEEQAAAQAGRMNGVIA